MRFFAVLAAVVCLAALAAPGEAFAQDTEDDPLFRAVEEQQALRTRSVDQVMAAPGRGFDRVSGRPADDLVGVEAGGDAERAARIAAETAADEAAAAAAAARRRNGPTFHIPWVGLAVVLPVLCLALLAWATWRRRQLGG